ncbi:hypothetical protein A6395_10605 [Exiguobacterium sp. SH31]|uniref:hypothetical protein n=1 Tax=unclassified Exiguobacterium TaxID=2644629 RepID=UPI0008D7B498|nr:MULTISPECIES: hypothetical protein [unclassified Exiguobacterium]OGX78783.1 hypothetical protein A6395_10605 [Exiguobacterium sp. SH31]TCI69078.1 hypothetical protein EVJ22_11445 [Exiguobacterium sp. SH0S7]
MDILLMSLFSLFSMLVPPALIITVIVLIFRFMGRYEKRADARLEFERQNAAHQQQQFDVLVERLERIEEKMETRP